MDAQLSLEQELAWARTHMVWVRRALADLLSNEVTRKA